jgi:hypothetical protein
MISGAAFLFLLFVSGAFKTGETARSCLFIYPYLFMGLINLKKENIQELIYLAGMQTAIMQLFGGYFW